MNYRTKKTFLHGAAPRSKFYRIHVCTAGVCLLLCLHNSFKQFIVRSKSKKCQVMRDSILKALKCGQQKSDGEL